MPSEACGRRRAEDTVVLYFATHGEVFDEIFYLLLRGLDLPIDTGELSILAYLLVS